jgi:lambda repressor-like predicted transcriptional regulator
LKDVSLVHLRERLSNLTLSLQQALAAGEARPSQASQAEVQGPVRFRPNRKLQSAEIAALVKSYRTGISIKALSRQFGLHEQTVRAHLARGGVELRPQQVLTTAQVEEIAQLYRAGASLRQLGLQYNVANNSIRNYLLRASVELRPARRLPRRSQPAEAIGQPRAAEPRAW